MKIARVSLPLFLVSTIPLRAAQPTDEEARIALLARLEQSVVVIRAANSGLGHRDHGRRIDRLLDNLATKPSALAWMATYVQSRLELVGILRSRRNNRSRRARSRGGYECRPPRGRESAEAPARGPATHGCRTRPEERLNEG